MHKARPHRGSNAAHGEDDHAALVILSTLADTTWRIFVPVLIAAGIGLWADVKWRTMPWLTLGGMVAGFVIAGWLIREQLRKVAAADKAREKKSP